MNLIEQLGGYDVAKEKYQSLSDSDVITIGPFEVPAKPYFKDELLEYCRQHNIFEVGDSVVPKKEYRIGDRVGTVEKMLAGGVWVVFDSSSKMLTPIYTIEHATDEEIKAGKRLEVS